MLTIPQRVAALSPNDRVVYESWAEEFEAAWDPALDIAFQIGRFLPPNGPARLPLLVHMAKCDMEFRSRQGGTPRIEHYLDCFPELVADAMALVDLLVCEHSIYPDDLRRLENLAWRISAEAQTLF
jgi:hypothetical protein